MKSKLDDVDVLRRAVAASVCYTDVLQMFGLTQTSGNFKRLHTRIISNNIDTTHITSNRISPTWEEGPLRQIIAKATTCTGVLRLLNLCVQGSNIKTLKKYINLYGIDISHFDSRSYERPHQRRNNGKRILTLNLIFVEDSTVSRSVVKQWILKHKLIEYKCVKCGNEGTWMDNPISLQLEHKNGVNNDNRLENLEFLCPNCHSQTSTFAGKNSSNTKIKSI